MTMRAEQSVVPAIGFIFSSGARSNTLEGGMATRKPVVHDRRHLAEVRPETPLLPDRERNQLIMR